MDGNLMMMIVICVMIVIVFAFLIFSPAGKEAEAKSEIFEGVVVEKEIGNPLFSNDPEYMVYVGFEFEHFGKTKTGTKCFTVDKETYTAIEVGDWFDSRTLDVTKPTNSTCSECGAEVTTNFCGDCGTPVAAGATE